MSYRSNKYIIFSTADWYEKYWTNKQHNAKFLARRGYEVTYIESMVLRKPSINKKDIIRIFKRLFNGIKSLVIGPVKINKNIHLISPLVFPFFHNNFFIKILNKSISSLFYKRVGNNAVNVIAYHPFIAEYLNLIKINKLIYHCVDDLSAIPNIRKDFKIVEKDFINQCDFIFVTNYLIYQEFTKKFPSKKNIFYFPNVVDRDHFKILPSNLMENLKDIKSPKVIFHGVLSDFKIDFKLLYNVIEKMHDLSFIILGEEREGQNNYLFSKIKNLKNVHHLGYIEYSEIPKYLNACDVGIIPSLINQYTRHMFPMKYFEFISCGLPVVTTNLPFIKKSNKLTFIANDQNNFIKNIYKALQLKINKDDINQITKDYTWDKRLDFFIDKIEKK